MTTSTHDTTADQRVRARVLVGFMLAFAVLGFAVRAERSGTAPAPCPEPALRDGLLVCDGEGMDARTRAWLVGGKLDVNRASEQDLEKIPGVGPSLATAIVEERARRGRFDAFTDLDAVPGIGPKTLTKLEAWISVE